MNSKKIKRMPILKYDEKGLIPAIVQEYKTKQVEPAFSKLCNLYAKIPDTEGCMENLDTCGGWCCKLQSPQVLY